jgi:hypothetical protein
MTRKCKHCHHPFRPEELCKEVSRAIEAQRRSSGVEGISFYCYTCSECGLDNLFVDIRPLEGETEEEFHCRRNELEEAAQELAPAGAEVVLVERRD